MSFHSPLSGVSQKDGIFNKIQRKGYLRELRAELGESKSRDGEAPGLARGLKVQEDRDTHRGVSPEGRAKRKSVLLSHFLPVQPCGREQPEPRKGQRTRGRVTWTAASTPAGREPQAAGSWRRGLTEVAASRRPALKHQGTSHPGPSVVTTAAPKDLQQMVCNSDEQELLTS